MQKLSCLFGVLMLLSGCGRDSLEQMYLLEPSKSPDGVQLQMAETDCKNQGLRFTSDDGFDSASLRQAEMERPFLTRSGRMRALETYVRRSQTLRDVFGFHTSANLVQREQNSIAKMSELSQSILSLDKNGYGGIVTSEKETKLFQDKGLEISKAEEELAASGLSFRVILGSDLVTLETSARDGQEKDRIQSYLDKAQAFWARFHHDLASPLIHLKIEALKTHLTTP